MGKLYVVSTPIGNLKDITLRAIEVLTEVDFIACEDTRETRKLLTRYGITTRCLSYHEHNKEKRTPQILKRLHSGEECALVSDRGTPAISDPGFFLVRAAIDKGIEVIPIPGSSAILASLVVSGLPTDRFIFVGFLPKKKGQRRVLLTDVKGVRATLILYVSPRILPDAVREMIDVLGDRRGAIVREVTKMNEEVLRGKLSELARVISERGKVLLGEFVLLIEGARRQEGEDAWEADLLLEALYKPPPATLKEGVSWLVGRSGLRRNRAYETVKRFLKGPAGEGKDSESTSGG
ncbi:MAG: 16S rRNA (cytidine(1402)-2'-O)-methyltransferase [Candidatus Glassbacteria bacterium]